MPVISFCGESYTVDHTVKGADYVHGYDENGNLIVSLEGVQDFSGISYDGTYMSPDGCLAERCNDVKYCGGALKKRDGTALTPEDFGALALSGGAVTGDITIQTDGGIRRLLFANDGSGKYPHNCSIYGGAPNSATGVGCWDYQNSRKVWTYDDQENKLFLGNTDGSIQIDGKVVSSLYLNKTTDASSAADNAAALIIGDREGEHIVFDNNEIIPKSGPTKGGTLYLGDSADTVISISGKLRVNSYSFGDTLPEPGLAGRIFFKKV